MLPGASCPNTAPGSPLWRQMVAFGQFGHGGARHLRTGARPAVEECGGEDGQVGALGEAHFGEVRGVSKKLGFEPTGAASAGPSQPAPTPHCSPATSRNPCSTAAADPTTQRSAPPPNAVAASQDHAASLGAAQSPTGNPIAPVPTPTTIHHDTRHQPKSTATEGTVPAVLSAPVGHRPCPAHPPDASPQPAAIPRCPPQYDAYAPSPFAGVVAVRPLFAVVFTDRLSIMAALIRNSALALPGLSAQGIVHMLPGCYPGAKCGSSETRCVKAASHGAAFARMRRCGGYSGWR